MNYDGMISLDYNAHTHVAVAIYDPSVRYEVADVLAHVDDLSDGRSRRVLILEGDYLACDMRKRGGRHVSRLWINVARHAEEAA